MKIENRGNNNPDNLMVFATKADHTAYHHGCDAVKQGDVYICPDKYKSTICPICGNKKDHSAKTCRTCKDKRLSIRPQKEKLIQILCQTQNKSKIGRMFGVSGNTVNKWIHYYHIDIDSFA